MAYADAEELRFREEVRDRLRSLKTTVVLLAVLAVVALGVAIWALLSSQDSGETQGASASRVSALEDQVDELERRRQERRVEERPAAAQQARAGAGRQGRRSRQAGDADQPSASTRSRRTSTRSSRTWRICSSAWTRSSRAPPRRRRRMTKVPRMSTPEQPPGPPSEGPPLPRLAPPSRGGAARPSPCPTIRTASPPTTRSRVEIAYPAELNRWLPLVKWLLVIPHLFVLFFIGIGAFFVGIYAFFAVLFTGRCPRGAFDYMDGTFRWAYRVVVYMHLMVDAYPPFSLADDPDYPVRLTSSTPSTSTTGGRSCSGCWRSRT